MGTVPQPPFLHGSNEDGEGDVRQEVEEEVVVSSSTLVWLAGGAARGEENS